MIDIYQIYHVPTGYFLLSKNLVLYFVCSILLTYIHKYIKKRFNVVCVWAHVESWIEMISFNKVSNHSEKMKRTTTSESWLKKWKSSFLLFLDQLSSFYFFLLLSSSLAWQAPNSLSVFFLLLLLLPFRIVHTLYYKRLSFFFLLQWIYDCFSLKKRTKKIIITLFICSTQKCI